MTALHYDVSGRAEGETVLLSSGLGGAGGYWAPQMAALSTHFRVVTYDHRGTGKSHGPVPDGGTLADMADDILAIADALQIDRFHLVGHALGGNIGLDIALRHPDRLGKLVVVNGWSRIDGHTERCFDVRIDILKASGPAAFVRAQPLFLYPAAWMSDHAARLASDEAQALAHFPGEATVLARIAALRAFDIDDHLARIATPTLVMATRDDMLVPFTRSVRLAEGLADAVLYLADTGGHAMNITEPAAFNAAMLDFLKDTAP